MIRTVKELREALKDIPDDCLVEVLIEAPDRYLYYAPTGIEGVRVIYRPVPDSALPVKIVEIILE
jgi:hypothetical protein